MPNKRIGQKYKEGQRVAKKIASKSLSLPPRVGVVLGVEIKKDRRGHPSYYYKIQWEDLKSPALHAQQVLLSVE